MRLLRVVNRDKTSHRAGERCKKLQDYQLIGGFFFLFYNYSAVSVIPQHVLNYCRMFKSTGDVFSAKQCVPCNHSSGCYYSIYVNLTNTGTRLNSSGGYTRHPGFALSTSTGFSCTARGPITNHTGLFGAVGEVPHLSSLPCSDRSSIIDFVGGTTINACRLLLIKNSEVRASLLFPLWEYNMVVDTPQIYDNAELPLTSALRKPVYAQSGLFFYKLLYAGFLSAPQLI